MPQGLWGGEAAWDAIFDRIEGPPTPSRRKLLNSGFHRVCRFKGSEASDAGATQTRRAARDAGAIDQTQLGTALAEQRRFGRPLGATLVRMGFLDEEALIRTLARQLKLPIAWLRGKWVEQEVLDLVPAELALKHRCLPLTVNDAGRGKVLHLAMQDPGDLETLDAIRFHVGHNMRPVLAAPSELEEALQRHCESGKSEGRAAARRPEVQEVPELLMFELKAQAATPEAELDFEFGTGPVTHLLMSSQAVLSALTQLLTVLMQKGIISREEVAERFRDFLPTKSANR